MMALISIAVFGLVGAIIILLAASMLSSQISSMEANIVFDESFLQKQEIDTPADPTSP